MTGVVDTFGMALAELNKSDAARCTAMLDGLPHALPRSLAAEADYLRAACLANTRSTVDREAAVDLLESWAGYEAEEPELGIRLMQMRLFALTLRVDKAPGKALEGQIRQALLDRGDLDEAAHDAMYTLDRCAASLHEPETALIRTREASEHFGLPADSTILRRPGEYFRCLVNLGAELLINAHYAEARELHTQLDALVSEYAPGTFPRLDYPGTNGVLADYRAGEVNLEGALRRQREVVGEHRVDADPFYVENALAVYLTLSGAFEEALDLFQSLEEQLNGMQQPEASTFYIIAANKAANRYVSGDHEEAHSLWKDLSELVVQIPYATRRYYVLRHELLDEVMRSGDATLPGEFDRCLLSSKRLGRSWDQLGRGFRLPEIEWWH